MTRTSTAKTGSTARNFTVEVHRDIEDLREFWRAFQDEAIGGPHDTWEWNRAWVRTAGKSARPLIAIGRDRCGEPLFLLPLTITRRMGCAVLEWLGAEQGNYASGLFHPQAWRNPDMPRGEALLARVLAALPPVDAIYLLNQPETIGGIRNPLAGMPCVRAASDGHAMRLGADWETHFNARFSARQRSHLRRNERRLAEHGMVHLDVASTDPERFRLLDGMIREKRQWLAGRGIADFLADPAMREFFRSLARLPGAGSGLTTHILTLRVGGEPVASAMGLVHRECFYGLVASTTAGPLRRFAPGRLLQRHLVEYLAGAGIERIDFGAGEDEEKLRWCTEQRARLHAVLPVTARGYAYAAVLKTRLRAKRHIKRTPRLWALVGRMRTWKAALKSQARHARENAFRRHRPRNSGVARSR